MLKTSNEQLSPKTQLELIDFGVCNYSEDFSNIANEAMMAWCELINGKTALIFVDTIEHGEMLEDLFNIKFGYGFATSFNGYTKSENLVIEAVQTAKTKVVIGVLKLTIGSDLPIASVCINVSPAFSINKQVQRCGRVLRLDPNNPNKYATIVDFIYPDKRSFNQILYPMIVGKSVVFGKNSYNTHTILTSRKNEKIDDDYYDFKSIKGIRIIVDTEKVMRVSVDMISNSLHERRKKKFIECKLKCSENGIKSSSEYKKRSSELKLIDTYSLKSMSEFKDWGEFFQ